VPLSALGHVDWHLPAPDMMAPRMSLASSRQTKSGMPSSLQSVVKNVCPGPRHQSAGRGHAAMRGEARRGVNSEPSLAHTLPWTPIHHIRKPAGHAVAGAFGQVSEQFPGPERISPRRPCASRHRWSGTPSPLQSSKRYVWSACAHHPAGRRHDPTGGPVSACHGNAGRAMRCRGA
jgi:hypothetical protein